MRVTKKVKKNQGLCLIVGLAGAVLVSGCQRPSDKDKPTPNDPIAAPGGGDPSQAVAKVGDRTITLGEFQTRINRQSPYVRGRYSSLEHKKEFLNNMIRFEVLSIEAERRGFDKDPDAIHAMKQVMVQKLMKDQFEKSMNPDSIPETELRTYYDANKNLYNKPEEVRIAAIIMSSAGAAKKVAAEAKTTKGSTNKGFRALVSKHSTDEESRRVGGDLRYFSAANKKIPKAVKDAAFALTKTGQVAGPIRAGGKHYIIRQTARRMPVVKAFEKVADSIRDRLYRDKRRKAQRDFIGKLKKSTKIQVFDKRLKKVKIDPKSKASKGGHGSGIPSDIPAMPGDDRPRDRPNEQQKGEQPAN